MWERMARAQREPANAAEESEREHFNRLPTAIELLPVQWLRKGKWEIKKQPGEENKRTSRISPRINKGLLILNTYKSVISWLRAKSQSEATLQETSKTQTSRCSSDKKRKLKKAEHFFDIWWAGRSWVCSLCPADLGWPPPGPGTQPSRGLKMWNQMPAVLHAKSCHCKILHQAASRWRNQEEKLPFLLFFF